MKIIKQVGRLFFLLAVIFFLNGSLTSCSSGKKTGMVGVSKQKLKKSHKVGKYKVISTKQKVKKGSN